MDLVWLGVPFCLVGFASSRNGVSKREETGRRSLGRESLYCVGQGSGLADVVQERRLEGTLRAGEDGGRWEMPGSKFSVDVCSGGGACRFGVHEDGWMRWVAVEPCHLELRVSLWGDQSPESPYCILHLAYGHRGSRTEDRAKCCPAHRPPPTTHSATLSIQIPFCCSLPATYSGLAQTDLRPGLPRTTQVPIQSPGLAVKAKAAAATPSWAA